MNFFFFHSTFVTCVITVTHSLSIKEPVRLNHTAYMIWVIPVWFLCFIFWPILYFCSILQQHSHFPNPNIAIVYLPTRCPLTVPSVPAGFNQPLYNHSSPDCKGWHFALCLWFQAIGTWTWNQLWPFACLPACRSLYTLYLHFGNKAQPQYPPCRAVARIFEILKSCVFALLGVYGGKTVL